MALRFPDGSRTGREASSALGPSLAGARVRLEGRLELLEAATLRYRRVLRELRRWGWRARVRHSVELFREAAWLEPEVGSALKSLQARAQQEGWPSTSAALELGRVCHRERALLEHVLERRQRSWKLSGLSLTGRLAALVARLGRPDSGPAFVPLGVLERQGAVSVLTRSEGSPAVMLGLLSPVLPFLPQVPGFLVDAVMETFERGSRLLNWAAQTWGFPVFRAQIRYHRERRLIAMSLGLERPWLQQVFRVPADARVWVRDETGANGVRVLSVALGPVERVRDASPSSAGVQTPELILGGFGAARAQSAAHAAEQIAEELGIALAAPPPLEAPESPAIRQEPTAPART